MFIYFSPLIIIASEGRMNSKKSITNENKKIIKACKIKFLIVSSRIIQCNEPIE